MTVEPIEREPVKGIGVQHGPLRPDWGTGWADLQCDVCDATWTGPIGEPCEYCHLWHQRALEDQRSKILNPELPEDHQRHKTAIIAWTQRLTAAVETELVTRQQAETAMRRVTR